MSFDLSDYVDVAEREAQLFERYPDARVQVDLEEVRQADAIIAWKAKATIWRTPDDPVPVCDFAVEPVPGKTPYTRDSEAMNASTSAVGRAIVLAGFPSKKVASADEIRARQGNGSGPGEHEAAMPADAIHPSDVVLHWSKNKGKRLGELTPQQLAWYATEWQMQDTPSEYDHLVKSAAVALHSGDDSAIEIEAFADVPFQ